MFLVIFSLFCTVTLREDLQENSYRKIYDWTFGHRWTLDLMWWTEAEIFNSLSQALYNFPQKSSAVVDHAHAVTAGFKIPPLKKLQHLMLILKEWPITSITITQFIKNVLKCFSKNRIGSSLVEFKIFWFKTRSYHRGDWTLDGHNSDN